jgi:SpoVK/Ycf46/Vps4 family AAA+-type ATPase
MTASATPITNMHWMSANSRYLTSEMVRLRLLLRRRALWLRKHWNRDAQQMAYLNWAISDREADLLLAGSDGIEEQNFYSSDAEVLEIGAQLDSVQADLAAQLQEMEESRTQPAVEILVTRFGLTSFERNVLLLCLASEIDPAFERIFGYLHDDATRKVVSPHLVLALFAGWETAGTDRAALFAGAPLRRWRLINWEASPAGSVSGAALRLDERITNYLLGFNQLDQRCQEVIRDVPACPLPAGHRDLAASIAQQFSVKSRRDHVRAMNLVGDPDSGQVGIAREVSSYLGLSLCMLDRHALLSPDRGFISLLEREAILLDLLYYMDCEALKGDELHSTRKEIERFAGPLVVATSERLPWSYEVVTLYVPRLNGVAQRETWRTVLSSSEASSEFDVDALAEQFDLGPLSILRAARHAEALAELRSNAAATFEDLWQACRQQAAPHLESLAQKVTPCYDWADIVVPSDVLCQLREITDQVDQRYVVYQNWGFEKKLSRGRGISALFTGASGVGKTMAAEVMAHHLSLDLYRIDLAGVVSKYIGETEKNLRCVFDAAERSGAILFFDEADALFGKRSEVRDSHDRYANIEVNYLLQRMENYRGLAILATNMKSALDSAFLRRLRFIVEFPFPTAVYRAEIWRRVFPPTAELGQLDFSALARLEIPGGNIRNIAVNSAFLAAAEGSLIEMDHVMRAARREYAKMDRLVLDSEFGRYTSVRMQ